MKKEIEENYIQILKEELVPSLGCTEPIAIAYASARAKKLLGELPQRVEVSCSGNIVKNAQGVVVPMTDGMIGIAAATTIGLVGGNSDRKMEVLAGVQPEDIAKTRELLEDDNFCTVKVLPPGENLHIIVEMWSETHSSLVEIMREHTNITREYQDGTVLLEQAKGESQDTEEPKADRDLLNVHDILQFAETIDLSKVEDILQLQIANNTAISQDGLEHSYGANIGSTLLKNYGDDIHIRARAVAAAASDARMGGSALPVVINAGSGNQGITTSLPVIEYAKEWKVPQEKLLRALLISNLLGIHQKTHIGRMSAYCGAVSAACGSGAAITYLAGGTEEQINHTIINTLANLSGTVCDGAKPSCAIKIASAIDSAILGHHMAMDGEVFSNGEGLVKEDVEKTIACIGKMAKNGMAETDRVILNLMISD